MGKSNENVGKAGLKKKKVSRLTNKSLSTEHKSRTGTSVGSVKVLFIRLTIAQVVCFRTIMVAQCFYFRRRCKMAAMQLLKVSNVLSIMQFLSTEPP